MYGGVACGSGRRGRTSFTCERAERGAFESVGTLLALWAVFRVAVEGLSSCGANSVAVGMRLCLWVRCVARRCSANRWPTASGHGANNAILRTTAVQ
eukprot:405070-Prymnesium_polylepis.1